MDILLILSLRTSFLLQVNAVQPRSPPYYPAVLQPSLRTGRTDTGARTVRCAGHVALTRVRAVPLAEGAVNSREEQRDDGSAKHVQVVFSFSLPGDCSDACFSQEHRASSELIYSRVRKSLLRLFIHKSTHTHISTSDQPLMFSSMYLIYSRSTPFHIIDGQ